MPSKQWIFWLGKGRPVPVDPEKEVGREREVVTADVELTSSHKVDKAPPLGELHDNNDESIGLLGEGSAGKPSPPPGWHVDDLHPGEGGTRDHSSSTRNRVAIWLGLALAGGLLVAWEGARDNGLAKISEREGKDVAAAASLPAKDNEREGKDVASAAWLTPAKRVQIQNYINGTALLLGVHITHHAGTTVCGVMKQVGPAPAGACNGPGKSGIWPENGTKSKPWIGLGQTAKNVKIFRPFFHFMSWEFSKFGNLHHTNWEYEDLVSMIVMKDPLERFLSGGKCGRFHKDIKSDPGPDDQGLWWEYANDQCSDNFALRVLAADAHCVDGARTGAACLESAKSLLRRFTFVLDASCLGDSMAALGAALHLNITPQDAEGHHHHRHAGGPRERLNNDTLYEFLRHRFHRDIELYEWSKARSIVRCPAGIEANCSFATPQECKGHGCSWSKENQKCRPKQARADYNNSVSFQSPDPSGHEGNCSFATLEECNSNGCEWHLSKEDQQCRSRAHEIPGC